MLVSEALGNYNEKLADCLSEKYLEAFSQFNFAPVEYLPSQKFTNLGVFARKDIGVDTRLLLPGFLAELPSCDDLPEGTNVSVFKRKGEELMLGPLSFVNHSCWPNSVYIINQGWSHDVFVANCFLFCEV